MLHADTTKKIARLQGAMYTPIATAQKRQGDVQQFLLSTKINEPYRTQHPQVHRLHIPTPKSVLKTKISYNG